MNNYNSTSDTTALIESFKTHFKKKYDQSKKEAYKKQLLSTAATIFPLLIVARKETNRN